MVVLVVFGFLAFASRMQSRANTGITGLAIYGMKAHQLALAAADEARLLLSENLKTGGSGTWKNRILDALRGSANGQGVEVAIPDFAALLVETRPLIQTMGLGSSLVEASLVFHGFHRLSYADGGLYNDPRLVYHQDSIFRDSASPDDPNKAKPPEDWQGYATIQVRVRVRDVERQVQVSHDVKVVDVTPPAREFALFNWLPLDSTMRNSGLEWVSLNRGGKMHVWPNQTGRVMMRGPYVVLSEGEPEGTGGKSRSGNMNQNYSYPVPGSRWHGWSTVPGRRALRWNQLAWPGGRNIRPKDRGTLDIWTIRYPTKQAITIVTNDRVSDAVTDVYFSAATHVGKQTFSIFGTPGNGAISWPQGQAQPTNQGFQMYRGMRIGHSEDGRITSFGLHDQGVNLGGGSNGDVISPEGGGLWGLYNQATFENTFSLGLCICYVPPFTINTSTFLCVGIPTPGCFGMTLAKLSAGDPLDPQTLSGPPGDPYALTPFGLRYMEKESVPIWQSLVQVAISYALSAAASGSWDTSIASIDVEGMGFGEAVGEFFGEVGSAVTSKDFIQDYGKQISREISQNQSLSEAAVQATGYTDQPSAQELSQAMPDGIWPPKWRSYLRAATRLHRHLDDALDSDGNKLDLEGVLVLEEMDQNTPASFTYQGKGILAHVSDGVRSKNPFLGDIAPARPAEDWMTFSHQIARPIPPDGGDGQVRLNSNSLELSIYAQEGVTTDVRSSLYGNLVTALINKFRIPQGAQFDLFYNKKRLAPKKYGNSKPDTQWNDGSWKAITVSPKISGYYDRYR